MDKLYKVILKNGEAIRVQADAHNYKDGVLFLIKGEKYVAIFKEFYGFVIETLEELIKP